MFEVMGIATFRPSATARPTRTTWCVPRWTLGSITRPSEVAAKRGKTVERNSGLSGDIMTAKKPSRSSSSRAPSAAWRPTRSLRTRVGLEENPSNRHLEDTPAVRGMINKVSYMLEVAA